jgi:ATP-dependent Clp protease ATP-binding subunit ClpA
VEATAECLIKNPRAVIKIDCGEFQHSHEIAKLIGSPPGYLGHRETHPLLSQEVLNQYHSEKVKVSFVLFDEIEKASDSLWNLLLGILDKATLTLGDNRKVDFSRAMIFMTSNVGASEMSAILNPKMGFATPVRDELETGIVATTTTNKISKSGVEAARRKFPPEFVNRADKIVVFKPLGQEQLRRILDIELNQVQQRVFDSSGANAFVFTATGEAKDFLLREGTDVKYGARPLKRSIERLLVHPMSNLIATEQLRGGDMVRVDFDAADNCLYFVREAEGMPPQYMQQMTSASLSALAGAVGATAGEEQSRPVPVRGRKNSFT